MLDLSDTYLRANTIRWRLCAVMIKSRIWLTRGKLSKFLQTWVPMWYFFRKACYYICCYNAGMSHSHYRPPCLWWMILLWLLHHNDRFWYMIYAIWLFLLHQMINYGLYVSEGSFLNLALICYFCLIFLVFWWVHCVNYGDSGQDGHMANYIERVLYLFKQ